MSGDAIRRMPLEDVIAATLPHLQAGRASSRRRPTAAELAKVRCSSRPSRSGSQYFSQILESGVGVQRHRRRSRTPRRRSSWIRRASARCSRSTRTRCRRSRSTTPRSSKRTRGRSRRRAGLGFGKLVHPVRAAVTGRTVGPPLFDCFCILGRSAVRARPPRGGSLNTAAGRTNSPPRFSPRPCRLGRSRTPGSHPGNTGSNPVRGTSGARNAAGTQIRAGFLE